MIGPSRAKLAAGISIAALISGLAVVDAQTGSEAPQKIASVEGITEYRLDNGLRVLLFPDQSRPKVTVNLTILVGSRHEGYGETGMAHLLEHMVFKGTPTHPDIPRGRTMQFQADLEQKIKQLTPETVNAVLRKCIDPKRLSVITAGDFKKWAVGSRQ